MSKPDAICRQHGWTLSKQTFQDLGVSAYTGKNRLKGHLATFIKLAKDNRLAANPVLIIEAFDRFSRQDIDESEPTLIGLLKCGVDVHVAFSNKTFTAGSTKSLADRIEILVALKSAYEYSANLSTRIKAAKERKRREIQSGKPVPHNNAPKYFTWNKDAQRYEHNEKTQIVKRLVKMFLAGNTLYSIARTLNREHVPTVKTDSAWSGNAIRSILKNRTLLGEFLGAKDFFPPIVDPDTFEDVRVLLKQNPSFNKGKPGNLVNVFRGIAYCVCGRRMCVLSQTKDPHTKKPHKDPFKYRYLRCNSQGTGKNCDQTFVMPLREMEDEFFGFFLMRDPRELIADNSMAKELNSEITKVQLAIGDLDAAIGKAVALIRKRVAMAAIEKELAKLEAEKSERQSELDRLSTQAKILQVAPGQFDDLRKLCFAVEGSVLQDDLTVGPPSPSSVAFNQALNRMRETLKDNEVRRKIRIMLPNLLGKIVVDTPHKRFEVFNHQGASIYKSRLFYTEEGPYEPPTPAWG